MTELDYFDLTEKMIFSLWMRGRTGDQTIRNPQ